MKTHNIKMTPEWKIDFNRWIEQGTAKSTRRAYDRDVKYFWTWMNSHLSQNECYPATTEDVIQFCLYHLNEDSPRRLKVSTLRRYLASLSIAHQEEGLPNYQVKLLLKRTKAARIERPVQKAAITQDILEKILMTCDNSLIGVRDRAILLLAFYSGGRRRSEIVDLSVSDISRTKEGYDITLRKSKTDQDAMGFTVPLSGIPATALNTRLVKSGLREGKLFRGIKSNGTLYPALTGTGIYKMVKKRVQLAGLNEELYSAHSLRAGFITDSVQNGNSIYKTMQYSGHKDINTAQRYIRLK